MKLLDSDESRTAKPDSMLRAMEASDLELQDYLKSKPTDVEAALVLMRLHNTRTGIIGYIALFTGAVAAPEQPEPYAGIVDRALQADSLNAELHYWRGRLYSLPEAIKEGSEYQMPRLQEGIREIRRAVAIDPKETKYRESLAYLVLQSGNEAEARAMFKARAQDHPMYLLLHDWERMPVIAGTVAQKNPMQYAFTQSSILAYPALTMSRLYLFHGTAAKFEASCRKRWRSFHLILDPDPQKRYPEGTHRYAQHLSWKGDVLEPDAVQSQVSGGQQPGLGTGGMWVEVMESRALATDPTDAHPGIKPGESYCAVEFSNKRAIDADSEK